MTFREKLVRAVYASVASSPGTKIVERLTAVSERQSLRHLLEKLRIDCVIDVGANEGQYARLLRRLGFGGLILSFEPNLDVFGVMQRTFADDASWRGFNCALGSADAELDFNVFEHSQISSFLAGSDSVKSKLVRTAKVPVRRLDAFLPEILPGWDKRRLFLKCDTQGFDLEVVKGAEGVLEAVCGLQSEIAVQPLYQGMPRYLEALSFYESLDFVLCDLWLNNRTVDGDVLEYDCLMRRTALEKLP
jgi:FkbM family methyltransferase